MNENSMSGWNKLGKVFGGGDSEDKNFLKGAGDAATLEEKMAKARKARDEARAREEFDAKLEAAGYDAKTRALLAGSNAAGYNPAQNTSALQDLANMRYQSDAAESFAKGDVGGGNRLLGVTQGRPMSPQEAFAGDLGPLLVDKAREEVGRVKNASAANAARADFSRAGVDAQKALAEQRRAPKALKPNGTKKDRYDVTDPTDPALAHVEQPSMSAFDGAVPPPPEALATLQAGKTTTFANGQQWTIRNGKPTRLK